MSTDDCSMGLLHDLTDLSTPELMAAFRRVFVLIDAQPVGAVTSASTVERMVNIIVEMERRGCMRHGAREQLVAENPWMADAFEAMDERERRA